MPIGVHLRRDLVAGFQWPRHALDLRLSSDTQACFPTRDLLYNELLTFPIQHIAIDSKDCSWLRTLHRLCGSDHGKEEKKSKKNWHY